MAETKEQAYADVEYGLDDYYRYFREVAALPVVPDGSPTDLADQMNSSGAGVIGTPDDLIGLIDELIEQSNGGFGTLLIQAHEWANPEATRRSYELISQFVMPHFQGSAVRPAESMKWVAENRPTVHRRGRRRHHVGDPEARRGEGGQVRPDQPVKVGASRLRLNGGRRRLGRRRT